MKKLAVGFSVGMTLLFVGCSNDAEVTTSEENPTVEEVLAMDPDSDLLMFNGIVYSTNIDWVDELTLTKGEQLGEVTEQADEEDVDYANGTANKLSVGSLIFEAEERDDVLLVEENGVLLHYYALVEG